jgi:hypothetical protein
MKKKFLLLIATFYFIQAKAQMAIDSFEVKENKMMKTYNFLTMARTEELSVWKFKALPFNLDKAQITYLGTPIIVAYERKLSPNFSFQIESKFNLFDVGENTDTIIYTNAIDTAKIEYYPMGYSSSKKLIFNWSVAAEMRYYYNMKRKMHKKHHSNNFSANYFALKVSKNVMQTGIDFYQMRFDMENPLADLNKHPFYDDNISLYYGIQRRFLKIFFFDVQLGGAYRYSNNNAYWVYYTVKPNSPVTSEKISAPRFVAVTNFRIGFAF